MDTVPINRVYIDLLTDVKAAVDAELTYATKKHGEFFNSQHESYAVLLEEYEEAATEATIFKLTLQELWNDVKGDIDNPALLIEMQEHAERAASEWIQVAAMCRKALLSGKEKYVDIN